MSTDLPKVSARRNSRSVAALVNVVQKRATATISRPINLQTLFKIYMLDDSFKLLQLTDASTIADVLIDLKFKLDLSDVSSFAIFREDFDTEPERVELSIKVASLSEANDADSTIKYVFRSWCVDFCGEYFSKVFQVQSRLKDTTMELYLAYIEANYYVMKTNKYHLSDEDSIFLGCLHMQMSLGDYNPLIHTSEYIRHRVRTCFPNPIKDRLLNTTDDKNLKEVVKTEFYNKITHNYERFHGLNKSEAQIRFIRYLSMTSPYVGSTAYSSCKVALMRQAVNITNSDNSNDDPNSTMHTEYLDFYTLSELPAIVTVCSTHIILTPTQPTTDNNKKNKKNKSDNIETKVLKDYYDRIIHYALSEDQSSFTYYMLKDNVSLEDIEEVYADTKETSFNYQHHCNCVQITFNNSNSNSNNTTTSSATDVESNNKIAELYHLFHSYIQYQRDGERPCLSSAPEELVSPLDLMDSSNSVTVAAAVNGKKNKYKEYVTATQNNIERIKALASFTPTVDTLTADEVETTETVVAEEDKFVSELKEKQRLKNEKKERELQQQSVSLKVTSAEGAEESSSGTGVAGEEKKERRKSRLGMLFSAVNDRVMGTASASSDKDTKDKSDNLSNSTAMDGNVDDNAAEVDGTDNAVPLNEGNVVKPSVTNGNSLTGIINSIIPGTDEDSDQPGNDPTALTTASNSITATAQQPSLTHIINTLLPTTVPPPIPSSPAPPAVPTHQQYPGNLDGAGLAEPAELSDNNSNSINNISDPATASLAQKTSTMSVAAKRVSFKRPSVSELKKSLNIPIGMPGMKPVLKQNSTLPSGGNGTSDSETASTQFLTPSSIYSAAGGVSTNTSLSPTTGNETKRRASVAETTPTKSNLMVNTPTTGARRSSVAETKEEVLYQIKTTSPVFRRTASDYATL